MSGTHKMVSKLVKHPKYSGLQQEKAEVGYPRDVGGVALELVRMPVGLSVVLKQPARV